MSSDRNDELASLCLLKIIDITKKLANPSQETLDWLLSAWTFIYQSNNHHMFPHGCDNLDLVVALHTLHPMLVVPYYEKDEILYVHLDKQQFYDIILQNEQLKDHIATDINYLKIGHSNGIPKASQYKKHLTLKSFLSECKSVKTVDVISVSQLFSIFECMAVCKELERISWFGHVSPEIRHVIELTDKKFLDLFFKYVLGIDLVRIKKKKNRFQKSDQHLMKYFQGKFGKMVRSSKPTWPKLTSLNIYPIFKYPNLINSIQFLYPLTFAVLKNLNCFSIRPLTHNDTPSLTDLSLKTAANYLQNRFQKVCLNNFQKLYNFGVVAEQVSLDMNSRDLLKEDLDMLCDLPPFSIKEISLEFRPNCYRSISSDKDKEKLLFRYPSILKLITSFMISRGYVDRRGCLVTIVELVNAAPNLKEIFLHDSFGFFSDQSLWPVCSSVIQKLVFDFRFFNYDSVGLWFEIFPFVNNLYISVDTSILLMTNSTSEIDVTGICKLNNLKSIHVQCNFSLKSVRVLLSFMVELSKKLEYGTKLLYTTIETEYELHLFLKKNGWTYIAEC